MEKGLVALVNIARGTRLLCEKPFLIGQPKTLADLERHLATQLKSLPKASQRAFLTLHNHYPGQGYPFSHTFKTNALSPVAQIHGDQARASVFAERSMQYRVVCGGEDSPEAKRMKGFVARPASHGSFGVGSRKWKTTKGMVPKGLDGADLEKWLWGGRGG